MLTSGIVRSWDLVTSTIKIFNAMLGRSAVTLPNLHAKRTPERFTASAVQPGCSPA